MDQGSIGSCTANALSYAVRFDRHKEKLDPDFQPSRLFVYYNERSIESDVPLDADAFLRDGIKSLASDGVCSEADWPYVPTQPPTDGGPFPDGSPPVTKPPASRAAHDAAAKYKIVGYEAVSQTIAQLRGTLAQGLPFVFGFSVYASLWDADREAEDDLPARHPAANRWSRGMR